MNENFMIISGLPRPYHGLNFRKESPEWQMQEHDHDFYQFFYIINGSMVVRVSEQDYTLAPGQICIVPPYVRHALFTNKGYQQFGINLNKESDERGIIDILNTYITKLTVLSKPSYLESIQMLQKETGELTPLSKIKVAASLDAFIANCIEDRINLKKSDFQEKLLLILKRNIKSHVKLNDISKEMSISQTQLERLSKKEFGYGVIEYFHRLKMNYACSLLLDKNKTVDEIAYILGYNDVAYFCRFFKNRLHMTPSEYRKKF